MYEFEEIETENQLDFSDKYDEMSDEIEMLYEEIADSDDRFAELEDLIRQGLITTQGEINAADQKDLAPDALKGYGEINAVDQKTLSPNALKDGRINPANQEDLAPNALKGDGEINAVDYKTLSPNALKGETETEP